MSIAAGQQLLHYRIAEKIGEGGMGVVWKAVDTTLDRDVAIKFLPDAVAADIGRLARFEREAKLLAALSHPNIATVHGLHRAHLDDRTETHFVAMELVPGEDLAAHVSRGPLPVETSLGYALQIAEALEAAHAKGIVHRDLKPANVRVTPEGQVKVLDFGLAKALTEPDGGADPAMSPTMTHAASAAGMILGTARYMAPEQARGQAADHRADVWALGIVLFEMLSGEALFRGPTISDTLAMVLQREPDWERLPKATPPRLVRLLRRMLTKDLRHRLQSVADGRIELEEIRAAPDAEPGPATVVPASRGRLLLPWLLLPVVAAAVWLASPGGERPDEAVVRTTIEFPGRYGLLHSNRRGFSVSPDGTRVAFVAAPAPDFDSEEPPEEPSRIWVRRMDQWNARPVPGTDDARNPLFSPDGQWLLFVNQNGLFKVDLVGGEPVKLLDDPPELGLAWSPGGTIAFTGEDGSLMGIPAGGGTPEPLTRIDDDGGERDHRIPTFLPDGETLLFTVSMNWYFDWSDARIVAWPPGAEEGQVLLEGVSDARYFDGHLIYAREGELWAAPFDPEALELTGDEVRVLDGVRHAIHDSGSRMETGIAQYDISSTGTLVYAPGSVSGEETRSVFRVARDGTEVRLDVEVKRYHAVRVSPDGKRLLLSTIYPPFALWTYDLERETLRRQTFEGMTIYGAWGPGEREITFPSNRDGPSNLYTKTIDSGPGATRLTQSPYDQRPGNWSPDGERFVFVEERPRTNQDILEVSRAGGTSTALLETGSYEAYPDLSPDGKWLAYMSNHSGRREIYARPYPGPGDPILVSRDGGGAPAWAPRGEEVYYLQDGGLWAVPFAPETARIVGAPVRLFDFTFGGASPIRSYDVAPDGSFVMVGESENVQELFLESFNSALQVVQHWDRELNGRE